MAIVGYLLDAYGVVSTGTLAYGSPVFVPTQFLLQIAAGLMMLGLPAVYARHSARLGLFGLVAFALFFAGMARELAIPFSHLLQGALYARPETRSVLATPPVAIIAMVFFLFGLYLVGSIAFGASLIRARAFSRGPGVLLIAGGPFEILSAFVNLPIPFGNLIGLAAVVWLGLQLARPLSEPPQVATLTPSIKPAV
jgi:hypothetical protein